MIRLIVIVNEEGLTPEEAATSLSNLSFQLQMRDGWRWSHQRRVCGIVILAILFVDGQWGPEGGQGESTTRVLILPARVESVVPDIYGSRALHLLV